ncbi:MAG: hypothetical protein Q8P34_04485 [Bacteroidota bacterium]|nr:hypothetical protein [Bacteroidota bacterium]
MINRIFLFSLILVLATGISKVFACTNLIVTKGASSDGSARILCRFNFYRIELKMLSIA